MKYLENYIIELENWLEAELHYRQAENFIFGVSGGVDSAVIAFLLKRRFADRSLGVMMPSHSHPDDLHDAKLVMTEAGLPYHIVDLTETHNQLMQAVGNNYNQKY